MKHILYLAAGNSRRFGMTGENKLLYSIGGKTLYRHGLDMLFSLAKKRQDCSLTVISRSDEILKAVQSMGVKTVYSPDSEKGISYTIRAGINSLGNIEKEDFLVFVVADQPYMTEKTVMKLLDCADKETETASVSFQEQPGNPVLFSARLIPELLELTGDEGGRKIIKKHTCKYIQAENEKELYDIDCAEDLIGIFKK